MIETYERKSTVADLNEYCHFAKEHDTIEVVEWVNGEGVDVTIVTGRVVEVTPDSVLLLVSGIA